MKKKIQMAFVVLAVPLMSIQAQAFTGHGDAETEAEAVQIALDHCKRNTKYPERCHITGVTHNPRVNATDYRAFVSNAK